MCVNDRHLFFVYWLSVVEVFWQVKALMQCRRMVLLLCQTLDGDYYERMQDFFTSLARAELSCANTASECFQQVVDDASKVNASRCNSSELFVFVT